MASLPSLINGEMDPQAMLKQAGGIGTLGQDIANIGNAASGIIPAGSSVAPPAMGTAHPMLSSTAPIKPMQPIATPGTGTIPSQPVPQAPTAAAGGVLPGSTPVANPIPGQTPQIGATNFNPEDLKSVYGDDTGNALTQLINSEGGGTASTTAQQIIQANAPNVAQGSAQLNEGLAASGISPSSSVSAIENANYMAQVQQQNLSTEAQTSLTEQAMQQQLLESLLPDQQKRQTDSSGWSIFGDILSGIGDFFIPK